jgi:hypothetical protein
MTSYLTYISAACFSFQEMKQIWKLVPSEIFGGIQMLYFAASAEMRSKSMWS